MSLPQNPYGRINPFWWRVKSESPIMQFKIRKWQPIISPWLIVILRQGHFPCHTNLETAEFNLVQYWGGGGMELIKFILGKIVIFISNTLAWRELGNKYHLTRSRLILFNVSPKLVYVMAWTEEKTSIPRYVSCLTMGILGGRVADLITSFNYILWSFTMLTFNKHSNNFNEKNKKNLEQWWLKRGG